MSQTSKQSPCAVLTQQGQSSTELEVNITFLPFSSIKSGGWALQAQQIWKNPSGVFTKYFDINISRILGDSYLNVGETSPLIIKEKEGNAIAFHLATVVGDEREGSQDLNETPYSLHTESCIDTAWAEWLLPTADQVCAGLTTTLEVWQCKILILHANS